jgi:transcriptional regulator with XRE-family HTH domain
MARARTEYEVATDSLKLALKKQKLTYKELGQRLGLSESGIKKILSASDGSFQRIAQICDVLGLSMRELFSGFEEGMLDLSYSQAQQSFLVGNAKALRLYWALVYERRPLAEAEKVAGLGAKEGFPLLRKLDQLHLLELLPEGRIRIPPVRQLRWVGGGPLVAKLYREWSRNFLDKVASPEPGPGNFFLIRYFRASERTLQDLMDALRDLEAEFVRRAIKEMRSEAPDLVHIRWMSAVDNRSYLE